MMSVEDRSYFIAAGESLAKYEAIIQQRTEANVRRGEFKKRFGADGMLQRSDGYIVGLIFKDKAPPEGWLACKKFANAFRPRATGKANKALWEEFETLRWKSFDTLGESHFGSEYFYSPSVRKVGDKVVISQHKDVKSVPADAIPIKRSEYLAMVEAEELATAGRPDVC